MHFVVAQKAPGATSHRVPMQSFYAQGTGGLATPLKETAPYSVSAAGPPRITSGGGRFGRIVRRFF